MKCLHCGNDDILLAGEEYPQDDTIIYEVYVCVKCHKMFISKIKKVHVRDFIDTDNFEDSIISRQ